MAQLVGYVRVSTTSQNPIRQLHGLSLDRTFTDTASGKDTKRPQLDEMIKYVRDGDTVLIESMDRLARNLQDLRALVQRLTDKGVQVQFIKEGITFGGSDVPMATLMLSVMGAVAEFERSLIRERQAAGIALAKARGAYRGRKRAITDDMIRAAKDRLSAGVPKAAIARELGISRQSLYHYLKAAEAGDMSFAGH